MACGDSLVKISKDEAADSWEKMRHLVEYHYDGSMEWAGWLRMVEGQAPDYCK
jgi:hypothetical protein